MSRSPAHPRSVAPSALSRVTVNAGLLLACAYFLFPIWWLVVASTKSRGDLYTTPSLWFADDIAALDNLRRVLEYDGGNYLRWIGNSLLYSGTAAVIGVLVSMAAGYALAKFDFAGKSLVMVTILGGLLLPSALLTIPLYFFFDSVGLVNNPLAVIIPSCASPFGVFLGLIFAETVPDEVIEAARIDGAGEIRIFFTIVLRMLAPGMVTIALFLFVGTWNNFLLPLVMLRDKELLPVTLGLQTWQGYKAVDLTDLVLIGSLVAVLPVIVLFLTLQRFWQSGLTAGAVKG